jgi:hypothetical protein
LSPLHAGKTREVVSKITGISEGIIEKIKKSKHYKL